MLEHLLCQFSKVPEPWFSKKYLSGLSADGFGDLVDKKILIYERPPGIEMVYSPSCPHGCSLAVEEDPKGMIGVCLDHPEVKSVRIVEDDLSRYKFSVEGLLTQIRNANSIKGEISKLGDGYYFGYYLYGEKRVGLVLFPSFGEELLKTAGIDRLLKDDEIILIISPVVQERIETAVYSGDRVIVLDIKDILDYNTLKLSLDVGIQRLNTRGVLKDVSLEFPGVRTTDENNEVRLNGVKVLLSDRPFLLLLRLAIGFETKKDHYVSTKELVDEKIVTEDGKYQSVGRLKEKLTPFLPASDWDAFFENDKGMYRLSSNVKTIIFHRDALIKSSARIKEIALKIPKTTKKREK